MEQPAFFKINNVSAYISRMLCHVISISDHLVVPILPEVPMLDTSLSIQGIIARVYVHYDL